MKKSKYLNIVLFLSDPPEMSEVTDTVTTQAGASFRIQCQSDAEPVALTTWHPPREQPIIEQVRADLCDYFLNSISLLEHFMIHTALGCTINSPNFLVSAFPLNIDVAPDFYC